MNKNLENQIRSMVKEAISEIIEEKSSKEKQNLQERLNTINNLLQEKDSVFSKIGQALGRDPWKKVDDPKFASKELSNSLQKAAKLAKQYKESALPSTSAINTFHDSILTYVNKLESFKDTLPTKEYEKYSQYAKKLVVLFKNLLNDEKKRIESYLKTIDKDVGDKPSAFIPKRPKDMGVE